MEGGPAAVKNAVACAHRFLLAMDPAGTPCQPLQAVALQPAVRTAAQAQPHLRP